MNPAVFRVATSVGADGKIELKLPIPDGTQVEVVVLMPRDEDFSDMVRAASSSLGFWDNPIDDEVWNNA
jgi:hypothetical protein